MNYSTIDFSQFCRFVHHIITLLYGTFFTENILYNEMEHRSSISMRMYIIDRMKLPFRMFGGGGGELLSAVLCTFCVSITHEDPSSFFSVGYKKWDYLEYQRLLFLLCYTPIWRWEWRQGGGYFIAHYFPGKKAEEN